MITQPITDVRERVCGLSDIATVPPVFARILELVGDDSSTALDLAAEIAYDPALSAKILRTVNSGFYGFRREILTIPDAVVILGFDEVERMALAISVMSLFARDAERVQQYRLLWRHSVACSVAGMVLELEHREALPSLNGLHVAGLLHDIGKAVLYQQIPEAVPLIQELVSEEGMQRLDAEREVLDGATHSELGAWVAEQWELPAPLVASIQYHHQPEDAAEHREMVYGAYASNYICSALGLASHGESVEEEEPSTELVGFLSNYAVCREKIQIQLQRQQERIGAFCASAFRTSG
jgi:HD-like signal output (HDOD) protein